MAGEESNPDPLEINYPTDLVSMISESRRMNRVSPDDPTQAVLLLEDGLARAEKMVKRSRERRTSKDAEYWAMYHAVNGQIELVADFLELTRAKPSLAGVINPDRMYAILALTYERRAQRTAYGRLQLPREFGRDVSPEQINQALDRINSLNQHAVEFRTKAGEEYQAVRDLAERDFKQFETQVGYRLNPDFLASR